MFSVFIVSLFSSQFNPFFADLVHKMNELYIFDEKNAVTRMFSDKVLSLFIRGLLVCETENIVRTRAIKPCKLDNYFDRNRSCSPFIFGIERLVAEKVI